MKSVLVSIQPKWVSKIASGEKKVEIRKSYPKIGEPFKVFIYCTKAKTCGELLLTYDKKVEGRNKGLRNVGDIPLGGKVVGEFICYNASVYGGINSATLEGEGSILDLFLQDSCISLKEAREYRKGKNLYGWKISNLNMYNEPKELSDFYRECGDKIDCYSCDYNYCYSTECHKDDECLSGKYGYKPIERPPQSWCYCEEVGK